MKRCLRRIIYLIIFTTFLFIFSQSAIAAEYYITTDDVNFRTGSSLDASIIDTISSGTGVEVLEHGWSKVRFDGSTGYIRSDFIDRTSISGSLVYKTTDGVNFRNGSSLDSSIIATLSPGTKVEVLEHGWSKVKAGDQVGYIRSDFLVNPATVSLSASAGTSKQILKTIDGVNVRSGPSTSYSILKTLEANTEVEVLERDPDGWTKIIHDGTIGYIRSDLLSVNGRKVELLEWSTVKNMIPLRTSMRVYDVRTGISYSIKCFSAGDHADVETVTKADTAAHLKTHNGVRSWSARPVFVTIGDRTVAASLHGMPHDVSWISDNDMNGHLCLHFLGSTTSSSSAKYKSDLQSAVQEAWNSR